MKNKIVLLLIALALFTKLSEAQSTNFSGIYRLTSLASGLCLDANFEKAYPLANNGGNYQKWRLKKTGVIIKGDMAYTLTSVATKRVLDGSSTAIYPFNYNGGNYQKWLIIPSDVAGYYYLKSVATGKVLDGDASKIYPFDFNGGSYQKWKLDKSIHLID